MVLALLPPVVRAEPTKPYTTRSTTRFRSIDHFVPAPWRDRVAIQYFNANDDRNLSKMRVRIQDSHGRTLYENSIEERWTVSAYGASGERKNFFMYDTSDPQKPYVNGYRNLLFAHGYRFLPSDPIVAYGDQGRMVTLVGNEYSTAVTASSDGKTLATLEFRRGTITLRTSSEPGKWKSRDIAPLPLGTSLGPGLSLALNSFGECFFLARRGDGETYSHVLYRCEVRTGKLSVAATFPISFSAELDAESTIPSRNQLYAPPGTHDVVFWSDGKVRWLTPQQ
ncbi:MAG: hypothetical protein EON58_02520 [Alphaproteobacteria bacterium]|nr:MAG: hypothetical protein EON58_02520 [Alphaproteobacteria bacterium]